MGGFFQQMLARLRQFMQGRYGSDNLTYFLYGLALILWIVNSFLGNRGSMTILSVLVLLLLGWGLFRMFSKNLQARYNENTKYLMLKNKVLDFFKGRKSGSGQGAGSFRDFGSHSSDPDHKIFNCPACRQKVRVPKGKGKIEITCPKCGNHFKRRT